jgi:signal peptidase I
LTTSLTKLWKNEYFQTVIMIAFVIVVVSGFWFGFRLLLNTDYPVLAVASGSMCMVQPNRCDGWSHPFDRTLHTGDLIVVQAVAASDIHAAPYPDGDILVFYGDSSGNLIVHRAVSNFTQGGKIFFVTQGDANGSPGPYSPTPSDHVVGKVVLRIPWIGHLALLMRNSMGVYVIMALIIIIIIIELALSPSEGGKTQGEQEQSIKRLPATGNSNMQSA